MIERWETIKTALPAFFWWVSDAHATCQIILFSYFFILKKNRVLWCCRAVWMKCEATCDIEIYYHLPTFLTCMVNAYPSAYKICYKNFYFRFFFLLLFWHERNLLVFIYWTQHYWLKEKYNIYVSITYGFVFPSGVAWW